MSNTQEKKKTILKDIGKEKIFILLVIGVLLLILSKYQLSHNTNNNTIKKSPPVTSQISKQKEKSYIELLEDKLKKVLEKIEGVGKVDIMITIKASKELVINKDKPNSKKTTEEKDNEGGIRKNQENTYEEETIITNNSDGTSEPFVIKEIEPEISGVIIIAEGGEDPNVKNKLIKTAEVLFNIPVHRIDVMKMK